LVSSITLQEAIVASNFSSDIEAAGEDLADATTKVLSAIKVCESSDKAKCVEAVSEVVSELGVASKDIEEAVTDCGGTSTQCAQDISDAATDLASATDDISKAVDDCASSADSGCTSDIMAAGQDLAKTGLAITTSIKDCKTTQEKQVIDKAACAKDML